MDKITAVNKLTECIHRLKDLPATTISDSSFKKWRRDTEVTIERIFGRDSRHINDFNDVSFSPGMYNGNNPTPAFIRAFQSGRASAEAILSSIIDEISDWGIDDESLDKTARTSTKVFVVHGHKDGIKETVARLLTKINLEPIILHEQPNKGRTLIEKFIDYSDVGYAVVLISGDDLGGLINDPHDKYKPRARQNVIMELGFFLGKLGRDKVCALYEKGVEIPSDYHGVVFVELDEGGKWKYDLGRELQEAGFIVTLNDIA